MGLSGYDSWLEEPFQRMCEESDRYYDFCEAKDLDPDSPEAEAAYEEFVLEQEEAYAEYLADREDDLEEWAYDEW